MEIKRLIILLLVFVGGLQAMAQKFSYALKDGKMIVTVNKGISKSDLDSFILRFDLEELNLRNILQNNNTDSLEKLGWQVEQNNKQLLTLSKLLVAIEDLNHAGDKIAFIGKHAPFDNLFPAPQYVVTLGSNHFQNKSPFQIADSTVTFYLRGRPNAKKVMLAGEFNDWSPDNLPMMKTDSGWVREVKLKPGKTWYKFIVDGNWIVDDDNLIKEHDGQGNTNSVFFVSNYVFTLNGYQDAKRVSLAGSFNDWDSKKTMMQKTATGWSLPVYLADGTHTYKFVVDGNWLPDPGNKETLPDGFGSVNSVIRLGKSHSFHLEGFADAREVWLMGSFNGWKQNELKMARTSSGWQLPYTLGDGNYEYKFVVDGKAIRDPANAINNNGNSYLTVNPNHTFRLKGKSGASRVYLAGDFNNWAPNSLIMEKDGEDWVFSVHLGKGKHLYKFIVDGEWIRDPGNKLWEENEFGTGNSIIWKE